MSKSLKKSQLEVGGVLGMADPLNDPTEDKADPTGSVSVVKTGVSYSNNYNADHGITNVSQPVKKMLSEGGTHSSQESLTTIQCETNAGIGDKGGNSTNAHVHCNNNSKENMSCIASSPGIVATDTDINGDDSYSIASFTIGASSASLEDTKPKDSSVSRESSLEGHNEFSGSRSNAHSSAESRSSDVENSNKRKQSRPVNMDFEKMKVSLILKDDDYDMDDLCITSSRTAPADVPMPAGGTPPGPHPLGTDIDLSLDWVRTTPGLEQTYTGVGFREGGRHTPNSGDHLSDSSSRLSLDSTSPTGSSRISSGKGNMSDKKEKPYWYNVLSPTYKSRSEDFKRIFKDIPADERLIVDYSCALQKDILVHGRIYITQNWICFYANIFRWETVVMLKCKDITSMTKEKTARVIPNAIQICTKDDKYFFTSFGTRDKTYLMLFRVWQNALTDNVMTPQELWQWVRYSYGEELGLNSSDEDYIQPSTEEEIQFHSRVVQEEKMEVEAVGLTDIKNQDDEDSIADPQCNGSHGNKSDGDLMLDSGSPDKSDGVKRSPHKTCISVTSADLPTDQGDTTEDEQDEVLCSGHDHLDIAVVEEVYNFSVDRLFEMIFTDSQLYRHFTEVKKTTELVQSQWSEDVDAEGDRHRTISYTLSLNYSIGPKTSPATEKQVLKAASNPGSFYLIDTECINSSIPYGDNFYVINRYCLARVTSNKCRLKITSAIKYRKSVWGLVKNFIEKNVTNGIIESFTCLANLLRQESVRLSQQSSLAPPTGKKKVLRRRRNVSDRAQVSKRPVTDNLTGHSQSTPVKNHPSKNNKGFGSKLKEDSQQRLTADILVRVVCVVLIILAVFNALLFYKLWSLEKKATLLTHHSAVWTSTEDLPQTAEDWVHVMEQQQTLHDAEVDRWKDVLASSVRLMNNMQRTLSNLEQSILRYSEARSQHRDDL